LLKKLDGSSIKLGVGSLEEVIVGDEGVDVGTVGLDDDVDGSGVIGEDSLGSNAGGD
jgi:hypothetical protein